MRFPRPLLPLLLLGLAPLACENLTSPEVLASFRAESFDGTMLELELPRVVSAEGGLVVEGGYATECFADESELEGWLTRRGGALSLEVLVVKATRALSSCPDAPGEPEEPTFFLFTYTAEIPDLAPGVYLLRVEYTGDTDLLDFPDPAFQGHVRVR